MSKETREYMAKIGRKGGKVRSPAKRAAGANNIAKARAVRQADFAKGAELLQP